MDFLLACPVCRGALLAHGSLCGTQVPCPHCEADILVSSGQPVTETLVDRFLNVPATGVPAGPLRRLRPAPPAAGATNLDRPALQRRARISPRRWAPAQAA